MIAALTRRPSPGWVRSTALLAGGGAAGQAILALGSVAVVAFFEPTELGAAAAFVALVGMVSVVAALRYDVALPIVGDDETDALLALCLVLVGATALIAGVGAIAFVPLFIHRYDLPKSFGLLRFAVGPAIALTGVTSVLAQLATRERAYGTLARVRVVQAAVQVGGQVSFGIAGAGAGGLAMSSMLGSVSGAAGLRKTLTGHTIRSRFPGAHELREVARRHLHLPTWSVYSTVCQMAVGSMLPVIVGAAYGLEAAGLAVIAQRVLSIPLRIMGEATSRTYIGDTGQLSRTDPDAVRRRLHETVRVLACLALVPTIALAIVVPFLARLLSDDWRAAGGYVTPLLPLLFAQFVATPVNQTLVLIGRLPMQAALATARLVAAVGPLLLVRAAGGTARQALLAYSIGAAAAYAGGLIVIDRGVRTWSIAPRRERDAAAV